MDDERRRARRVPAAQPRIRVPVLQPGADADRCGERVVAAGARWHAGSNRRRPRRGTTGTGRARRPRAAPAGRTVGRTDATGGGGACAGGPAIDRPRRRAHRKPGQPLVDRGLGPFALAVRRRRRRCRHGDPRSGRGALRVPRAAPCRRACVRTSTPPRPSQSDDAKAARGMDVLPADPPRRVDRRLAPNAAERDRRRVGGDGRSRGADTQIRARPALRLIRPVAHSRCRRRGARGYPERQRPAADRDGRPPARRGDRGGGGHPDRRRLDAGGRRRRQLTGSFCSVGRARSSCWSARSTASSAPAT